MNIEKPIFLDNQSTTALDSRVFEKMSPFLEKTMEILILLTTLMEEKQVKP